MIPQPQLHSEGRPLVLLLDTDPLQLFLLREAMRGHGCEIRTATSCLAATRCLEEQNVRAIVIQHSMPAQCGSFGAERLLDRRTHQGIPLIAVSPPHDVLDSPAGWTHWADRVVKAPLDGDQLATVLAELGILPPGL